MGDGSVGERIVIKRPGQHRFNDNEVIGITVKSEHIYCFDSNTGAALAAYRPG
jgi:hypothetical protein